MSRLVEGETSPVLSKEGIHEVLGQVLRKDREFVTSSSAFLGQL